MHILHQKQTIEVINELYSDIHIDSIHFPIVRKFSSIDDIKTAFGFVNAKETESELMFINHSPYRNYRGRISQILLDLSLIRIYIIDQYSLMIRGIRWNISYEKNKMTLKCLDNRSNNFNANCFLLLYHTLSLMLKISNIKSYQISQDGLDIVIKT